MMPPRKRRGPDDAPPQLDLDFGDFVPAPRPRKDAAALAAQRERARRLRPPLGETMVFRVRADLGRRRPPVWRRFDLHSDLTLDKLHEVLQFAFDWNDTHLHRFAIGRGLFGKGSESFATRFDIAQGATHETPEHRVRLDQALQEPGDALHYGYDFGAGWELYIKLESAHRGPLPRQDATCVGGRGSIPHEWADEHGSHAGVPFNIGQVNFRLQSYRSGHP